MTYRVWYFWRTLLDRLGIRTLTLDDVTMRAYRGVRPFVDSPPFESRPGKPARPGGYRFDVS